VISVFYDHLVEWNVEHVCAHILCQAKRHDTKSLLVEAAVKAAAAATLDTCAGARKCRRVFPF
jgi:hypothetical protein